MWVAVLSCCVDSLWLLLSKLTMLPPLGEQLDALERRGAASVGLSRCMPRGGERLHSRAPHRRRLCRIYSLQDRTNKMEETLHSAAAELAALVASQQQQQPHDQPAAAGEPLIPQGAAAAGTAPPPAPPASPLPPFLAALLAARRHEREQRRAAEA